MTPLQSQGGIIVYDWAKCRVLVDKQVINKLVSMRCTRSADISAGTSSIKLLDADKTTFESVNEGDEIEIYLSEQSPMTYANKVWGGFLESKGYDADNKLVLNLDGKEYTQRLIQKMTPSTSVANQNVFSNIEPGTIIKAIMSRYQDDFTTDNVLTGTSSLMTASFINKSLFDSVKQICDTYGYVFYINNDKDLVVRKTTTVVNTPASDYLTWSVNLMTCKEEYNKEFMVNSVVVYGSTSAYTSGVVEDSVSINTYTRNAKVIMTPSLTTSADCLNFANAYVAAYKDPLPSIKTTSRLIAFSEPLQYIQLTSTPNNLSGSYQIREITHNYGASGINTEITLSNKLSDLSISLGELLGRLSSVEVKAFT